MSGRGGISRLVVFSTAREGQLSGELFAVYTACLISLKSCRLRRSLCEVRVEGVLFVVYRNPD